MISNLIRLFVPDPRVELLRQMLRGGDCAEIGVFRGDFSAKILRHTTPRVLHLIDPWKYEPSPAYQRSWYGGAKGRDQAYMDRMHDRVRRRFRKPIAAGVVHMHRCASAEAPSRFADESLNWVYVDGNHQYEFVKADLEWTARKIKPGGLLCGDDYGVTGWWGDGVTRAVDEFAARSDFERRQCQNHQFILRKS